ncbi:MAG: hypothetical protein Q9160_007866 [Pyrenula sp. 1 TL-2023]
MPVNINQPSNKVSLTNVSLVRLRKGKKRYELACYKNKLLEFRQGLETDLDNVLQVPTIFLSVSKGATAPREDLEKSFGKNVPKEKMVEEILRKGELQVGAGERKELLERLEREVVEICQGRLVDPATKRVYSAGMVRKALEQLSSKGGQVAGEKGHAHAHLNEKMAKLDVNGNGSGRASPRVSTPAGEDGSGVATPSEESQSHTPSNAAKGTAKGIKDLPTWTGVVATKSAKSQALEAMKALIAWQPIPVMRARMRLRVTCPTSISKTAAKSKTAAPDDDDGTAAPQTKGTVKDRILGYVEQVQSQDVAGEEWEVIGFVEPGAFKGLGEFVAGETKGRGRVEVLDMVVMHED